MQSLPAELLGLIVDWEVRMCRCDKNKILPLRLVCRAFDTALKPYIFKTVQLEFSRFLRDAPRPKLEELARVGQLCDALYLDMMVVRDEEEIHRLSEVFQSLIPKVPEMLPLLASLRRYCMNESTFDENDFRGLLEGVLATTPNITRLKLNLPFQVVGQLSTTATLLLATAFAALANARPEEHQPLETLVLDHVSDTTINAICNNHMDLKNAIKAFAELKHLVLSIKRQESRNTRQASFGQNLWFLIRKAVKLESLCLIGWNVKRDIKTRRHGHSVPFNDWVMRSLPYNLEVSHRLKHLRYLELKRVDIDPRCLVELVKETSDTLNEIYLNEVYIKVFGATDRENTSLWIGHPVISRPENCCWVAEELRNIPGLKLDILRATCLGYDDFEPDATSTYPNYDLDDPSGHGKSFDLRFVEAVVGLPEIPDPPQPSQSTIEVSEPPANLNSFIASAILPPTSSQSQTSPFPPSATFLNSDSNSKPSDSLHIAPIKETAKGSKKTDYDAETFQRYHNTTSHFKRCIDGYFFNHNEQALKELQNIITVADRGMTLISAEIDRAGRVRV